MQVYSICLLRCLWTDCPCFLHGTSREAESSGAKLPKVNKGITIKIELSIARKALVCTQGHLALRYDTLPFTMVGPYVIPGSVLLIVSCVADPGGVDPDTTPKTT